MPLPFEAIPGPAPIENASNVDGDLASYQLKIHKEFGTLVKFKLSANTTAISVTDPKTLKQCGKIFDKPQMLYEFLEPIMGKLLFLPEPENKAHRKFTIEHFSPKLIENLFNDITKLISNELDDWLICSRKNNNIIQIQDRMKAFSMKLTVLLTCGEEFNDSKKLGQAIHIILEEGLKFQYDPNHKDKETLNKELKYLNNTIEQFIVNRKNPKCNSQFFLDKLLEKTDDEKEIRETLKETLMAGYHTIASTVCWTLYALAKYTDVSQKAYAEIDSLIKNEFQYTDLAKFKYLPLVIKETLRIYPAGPYTARKADVDMEIQGYAIPKGTTIFYPIWAVHMDATYWIEPEKFIPERFKGDFNRSAYLPFGFGARNCPGTNIANKEILLIVALTLKKLKLDELLDFKPQITENFVLTSRNDIQLKITPRNNPKVANSQSFLKDNSSALFNFVSDKIFGKPTEQIETTQKPIM